MIARNGGSADFVRRASAISRGENDPGAARLPLFGHWIVRLAPAVALAGALLILLIRHLGD